MREKNEFSRVRHSAALEPFQEQARSPNALLIASELLSHLSVVEIPTKCVCERNFRVR